MFTPRDHDQQRSERPYTRSPAHLSHACADMINSAHGALQRCTAGTSQTPATHGDSYPRIPADHDHQDTQVNHWCAMRTHSPRSAHRTHTAHPCTHRTHTRCHPTSPRVTTTPSAHPSAHSTPCTQRTPV